MYREALLISRAIPNSVYHPFVLGRILIRGGTYSPGMPSNFSSVHPPAEKYLGFSLCSWGFSNQRLRAEGFVIIFNIDMTISQCSGNVRFFYLVGTKLTYK